MPKDVLNFDYETFSEADLSKVGSHNYAIDDSTEVLMAAYSINGGKIEQWIPAEGQEMPAELDEALDDPEVEKWAWNAAFEMAITKHVLKRKINMRQWHCTMVLGHYCSFPGQLEKAGIALGLPEEKLKNPAGKRIMKMFSGLNKSRKKATKGQMLRTYWWQEFAKWEDYLEYNRDDVEAEREVYEILIPHNLPQWEWENWWMDQQINQAGIPVNIDMVNNAVELYEAAYAEGFEEMQFLTGLSNPMSTGQFLPWLKEQGYMFDDCKKGHIRQAYSYFEKPPEHWGDNQWTSYSQNEELERALELRLELSRSSIKKFHAMQRAVSPDGNLRNAHQFMGAQRTGRFAGRVVQTQNLPRPEKRFEKQIEMHADNVARLSYPAIKTIYDNPFDLLATCIRPAIQAPPGYMLVDADLNAIENRVLGWMANCKKILQVFEKGRDPYIDFATYLFHRDYDDLIAEYESGNGANRTIAKPGVLGCGYMLGPGKTYEDRTTGEIEATGLLGYAWGMGIRQFTAEQSKLSVDTFRREFKEVKDYWYAIERAAIKCVRQNVHTSAGPVSFDIAGKFLRMRLPSGRHLHYYKPRVEKVKVPWKNDDGSQAYKNGLTYEGLNDRKQWVRMGTHPGKLTENGDQAISRDLLVHGMRIAKYRHKLDVRLHVHDQNVALVREDQASEALEILIESMSEQPEWADGLPLGTAGFVSKVMKKD